jgi:nanoRNase/pAp phosphatase (c-di-AMP/oligoRNAs hydrolase)
VEGVNFHMHYPIEANAMASTIREHPFPKSMSVAEKVKRLKETVTPDDTLAIIINADPDSIASAMALKRIFWRRVRGAFVYHVNTIQRADNLALIRLLKINQQHVRNLRPTKITKWAILDSQPHHLEQFSNQQFDIVIDHHPIAQASPKAKFVEIRESYGANSTIMTEYLRAAKIKPSPKLATALFYGIKTDTDNFVRSSLPNDINAFRYLYQFSNMNIIKKIESSEITRKTLESFRLAMERFVLIRDMAFIHMDRVENPDILVMIADFFMRLAEATWSISSGVYDNKLIVILRNAGFRGDAGKMAQKLFGQWNGVAGGHKGAARAEVPLEELEKEGKGKIDPGVLLLRRIKQYR